MAVGYRDVVSWIRRWWGTSTYEAPVVVPEITGPTKFREVSGATRFELSDGGTRFREQSGGTVFDAD